MWHRPRAHATIRALGAGDVYTIRTPDGSEIGPCSGQTIKVLIEEGVIDSKARVVDDANLVPIERVAFFAAILKKEKTESLDHLLFSSDLTQDAGTEPLLPERFGDLAPSDPGKRKPTVTLEVSDDGRATAVVTSDVEPVEVSKTVSVDLEEVIQEEPIEDSAPRKRSGSIEEMLGPNYPIVDPWFAGLLTGVWRKQETGVLEVRARDITTTIYLFDGTPLYAAKGTLGDSLGRLLVRMGRITEAQLEQAVQHFLDAYQGQSKRIGEVMVELGMITPHEVAEALQIQTSEKILSCFAWTELEYTFHPDEAFIKGVPRFNCHVPALVVEGIRRHYDVSRFEEVLGAAKARFPVLRDSVQAIAERFGLDPTQRRLLEAFKGDKLLSMLRTASSADQLAAGQFLAALIVGGSFDIQIGPRSTRSNSGTASVPWHLRTTSAHETSSQPPSVSGPGAMSALWAEAAFKLGKRLAPNEPERAVEKFKQAIQLRPDAVEYRLMLTFTEYRLAQTVEEQRACAQRAVELAKQALRQDRKVASAHKVLGHFEKASGNLEKAVGHFKKALELDAFDEESQAEFRKLKG